MKILKNKIIVSLSTSTILFSLISPLNVFANEKCIDNNNSSKAKSYKEIMFEAAEKRRENENLKDFNFDKDLLELNQNELNLLKNEAETNKNLNLLIENLYENKIIPTKIYKITRANKIIGEDYKVQILNLNIEKTNIIFLKFNNEYISIATNEYKNNNNEIFIKLYGLDDKNKLNLIDEIKYDNEKNTLIKKLPKRIKRGIKVYGNWCGPGHSGPGKPVDAIDACCKQHDLCYDGLKWWQSKKGCDLKLTKCLIPVFPNTSAYGKLLIVSIISAFGHLNMLNPIH